MKAWTFWDTCFSVLVLLTVLGLGSLTVYCVIESWDVLLGIACLGGVLAFVIFALGGIVHGLLWLFGRLEKR